MHIFRLSQHFSIILNNAVVVGICVADNTRPQSIAFSILYTESYE